MSGSDQPAVNDLGAIVDPDGVEMRRVDSREIDDAKSEEMIALYRATFESWPLLDPGVSTLDHLRWKTSGPFTRIGSMQARVDGRLVLATTVWASWLRIGGRRFLRAIYSDTAVDPAYQGRGLYSRWVANRTRLVNERHDLSLHERGLTFKRLRGPLGRKGQALLANKVTHWYRILQPIRFAAMRRQPLVAPVAVAFAAVGALAASSLGGAPRRGGLELRTEDRFDARFEALFEDAASEFDFIGERSLEFLRWRYDRRGGPYLVRSVGGDRLLGYSVVRVAGAAALLVDLLALPGRTDVAEALAADAVETARRTGAAGVECWLSWRHPYRGALRRQGFIDSRFDTGIEYHAIAATADDLRALRDPRARVHFQMADTDLV